MKTLTLRTLSIFSLAAILLLGQSGFAGQPAQAQTPSDTPPAPAAPQSAGPSVTVLPPMPLEPALPSTSPSPSEVPAASSPQNSTPTISATINTNCRLGPSPDYPVVSALVVGNEATAIGRNADSSWWFVRDPLDATASCWLWSGSTNLQGDPSSLPVVSPPPLIPDIPPIPLPG